MKDADTVNLVPGSFSEEGTWRRDCFVFNSDVDIRVAVNGFLCTAFYRIPVLLKRQRKKISENFYIIYFTGVLSLTKQPSNRLKLTPWTYFCIRTCFVTFVLLESLRFVAGCNKIAFYQIKRLVAKSMQRIEAQELQFKTKCNGVTTMYFMVRSAWKLYKNIFNGNI